MKMVPLGTLSLLLAICTIHGFKKEKVDMLMPQVAPQNVSIFVKTNSYVINTIITYRSINTLLKAIHPLSGIFSPL